MHLLALSVAKIHMGRHIKGDCSFTALSRFIRLSYCLSDDKARIHWIGKIIGTQNSRSCGTNMVEQHIKGFGLLQNSNVKNLI
jgi:hypothetical protein